MKDFYDKYVSPKVESALEKYEEKKQTVLIILAVIGVVLLTACIDYVAYRIVMKYNERFEEETEEEAEEDYFEDEEDE